MWAAMAGQLPIVEWLVTEHSQEVDYQTENGENALMKVSSRDGHHHGGRPCAVRRLLAAIGTSASSSSTMVPKSMPTIGSTKHRSCGLLQLAICMWSR